jgi:hypothetical protein
MQMRVPPQLHPVAYVVRPRTPEGRHALSNTFYSPSSTRFEEECLLLEREVSLRQSNDVARVNRLHLVTPGTISTPGKSGSSFGREKLQNPTPTMYELVQVGSDVRLRLR